MTCHRQFNRRHNGSIDSIMKRNGIGKGQLAKTTGHRPSEVKSRDIFVAVCFRDLAKHNESSPYNYHYLRHELAYGKIA